MDEERRVAGRYHLLEPIGRGGMGVVWRAHDDLLDRAVAVKEVLYHPASEEDRETFNRRTIREARAAGRIDHPNVVVVHDVIEEDGRPWIVMQLVRAQSLGQVLRDQGTLPPARVAAIGLQVLDALCTAHAAGVLHRDVKPENVLLSGQTRVVLTDFGIATMPEEAGLTMTGGIIGTPAFMPPERLNGDPATPESDLWSLGATLYAAVEGGTPFDRKTPVATLAAILHDDPAPPRQAGALTPVLEGLLRKDPARRMGAAEAAALLNAALTAAPGPAPGPAAAPGPPYNLPEPGPWSGAPSGPPQPPPGTPQPPSGPSQQPPSGFAQPHGTRPYGGTAVWPGGAGPEGPTGPGGGIGMAGHPTAPNGGGVNAASHAGPAAPPGSHPGPGGPAVPPGSRPGAYAAPGARPPGQVSAAKQTLAKVILGVVLPLALVATGVGLWYGSRSPAGDETLAEDPNTTQIGPTTGAYLPSGDTSPSASPEPVTPSEKPSPEAPKPPKGWKTYHDPLGFSIALPSGWVPFGREGARVRFHHPNSHDYLQVDLTPWEDPNPVNALRIVEMNSTKQGYLPGYERIDYKTSRYLGVESAEWEFTFKPSFGKVRVIDRAFRLRDGRSIMLYWQVADSRWTSGLSYFNAFTRTFQPA
ncbi:serine/threonine protein kinase [Microbispora hainanensis]|uniref:non-specific serine/threonine protein kinase n=1 Tax=Microbispora hainanensis TaxID=568844 RepID=A0ABZ1STY9_9ACTN|nr:MULTISPECIES: serine/threonine-protein kinase [Microbispora]NJP22904.1 serine/threonine protein kinase [Microbispora sp. CL1-1]TQS16930.1 serine/threonine protein kinase [Microbispora sp. SCL1-1]